MGCRHTFCGKWRGVARVFTPPWQVSTGGAGSQTGSHSFGSEYAKERWARSAARHPGAPRIAADSSHRPDDVESRYRYRADVRIGRQFLYYQTGSIRWI